MKRRSVDLKDERERGADRGRVRDRDRESSDGRSGSSGRYRGRDRDEKESVSVLSDPEKKFEYPKVKEVEESNNKGDSLPPQSLNDSKENGASDPAPVDTIKKAPSTQQPPSDTPKPVSTS